MTKGQYMAIRKNQDKERKNLGEGLQGHQPYITSPKERSEVTPLVYGGTSHSDNNLFLIELSKPIIFQ